MTEMRLHVALARAGVASRRHAEAMILAGRVRVNGSAIATLGSKVDLGRDRIEVDGRAICSAEPLVSVLLYKPDSVLTTLDDPGGRETVGDLLKAEPYKLRPIGRLDYHTEGVLLLSTDGELGNRLLHPRHHVSKTYQVKVGGHPSSKTLDRLRRGIDLPDGKTRAAVVEVLESDEKSTWLEIIVTEGRNRLIRRMCEAVDHRVLRLVRVQFATLGLSDLRPGQYRYLRRNEIEQLYALAEIPPPLPDEDSRTEESGRKKLGAARRRKGLLPGEERAVNPARPRAAGAKRPRPALATGERRSRRKN